MQNENRLLIKGMVCDRCVSVIRKELEELGVPVENITLGEVTVNDSGELRYDAVKLKLVPLGFDIVENKKLKIVSELKQMAEEIYSGSYDFPVRFRFSDLVLTRFHRDYDTISSLFSSVEKKTLEKYIIDYRIGKVKELLINTDQGLADIAFAFNFSSVAHLARQFRQYTGMTTSGFRELYKKKSNSYPSALTQALSHPASFSPR